MMNPIDTGRLIIRPLQVEDAGPLAALWADPQTTHYMGGPRSYADVHEWLEEESLEAPSDPFNLWTVVDKETGEVIGHSGLLRKEVDGRIEIELVYVFAITAWGKGYATEAAAALRDFGFQQLGLRRIIALIDPQNLESIRVAEKIGMQLERETRRPSGKIMYLFSLRAASGTEMDA